jgi:hypothetical protein
MRWEWLARAEPEQMWLVSDRKTPIVTTNISIFHMIYREQMFISDEFNEFC